MGKVSGKGVSALLLWFFATCKYYVVIKNKERREIGVEKAGGKKEFTNETAIC